MKINDFAKKYGVATRTIAYWSTLGLLRFTVDGNGYRNYGKEAEEDIKIVLIAKFMGSKIKVAEDCRLLERMLKETPAFRDLAKAMIRKQMEKDMLQYECALARLKALEK